MIETFLFYGSVEFLLTGAATDKILLCFHHLTPNFTKAYLSGADLAEAKLWKVSLTRALLCDINFTRADLSDANLTGATLSHANLTKANLSGANLAGVGLVDVNLTEADLRNADLTNISWQNIKSIKLANIYGVKNFPDEIIYGWITEHGAANTNDDEEWKKLLCEKR